MAAKVPQGITVTQSTSNKVVKKISATISEKQLAAKKQSEAAKKYLEEQARVKQALTPKGVGKGRDRQGRRRSSALLLTQTIAKHHLSSESGERRKHELVQGNMNSRLLNLQTLGPSGRPAKS